MNARVVAFVACRLMALVVALNFLSMALVSFLLALFSIGGASAARYIVVRGIAVAIFSGLAAGCWIFAGPLSDQFKSTGHPATPALTAEDAKSLAIAFTGGLFLFGAIRAVDAAAAAFLRNSAEPGEGVYSSLALQAAIFFLVGVVLMAFAARIVRGINALRHWGNQPFFGRDGE